MNPATENLNSPKHLQQSPSVIPSSDLRVGSSLGETSELHCHTADGRKGQGNASSYAPGASTDQAEQGDASISLNQITPEEAAQLDDADEVGEDDCQ